MNQQYHNVLSSIASKDRLSLNLIVWPSVFLDIYFSLIIELSSILSTILTNASLLQVFLHTSRPPKTRPQSSTNFLSNGCIFYFIYPSTVKYSNVNSGNYQFVQMPLCYGVQHYSAAIAAI
jgi:hypothetical protein